MKKLLSLSLIFTVILAIVSCGNIGSTKTEDIRGKSAYDIAVEKGYKGTQEEWLASLVGETGASGKDGANGKSAYELACENGYIGSEVEWLASLVGTTGVSGSKGKSAYELACENGFDGSLSEWLDSLVGKDGVNGSNGVNGTNGTDGKSAYELACENGFEGSLTEWLASLVGATGENGTDGKSAYEIAVENGYDGDVQTWLASLVGTKGDKGDDGITPQLKIGEDNYWYVSYDNGITWTSLDVKATGDKGEQGNQGNAGATGNGIKKTEIIDGYLWITYTDGTSVNIGKLYNTYEGTEGLDFYLLPDGTYGVTAGKAIYLDEIIIPAIYNGKSVTQILPNAFKDALNLVEITFPNSINLIYEDAFLNCNKLEIVNIEGIEFWCNIRFKNAKANPLSNSLSYLWINGTKIDDLVIPEGVETLKFAAFYGSSINSVSLPSTLKTISKSTFAYCANLTDVTIPAACTSIGEYAFYKSGITSVIFENSVGWKLENNVSYVSYTTDGVVFDIWKDNININKNGKYYPSSSDFYYYQLNFNINSSSQVAKALRDTTTITSTYHYATSGINGSAGDVRCTGILTVNLYTQKWIRE